MNYLACIGLLVLLGLLPQGLTRRSHQARSPANTDASRTRSDDPEQLFVEAMKQAEADERTDASKLLDEACLLWTKRSDPERAARARLEIGDLYRSDKRFNDSLNQYRRTLEIQGLSSSLRALTYNSLGQIYAELYQSALSQRNYSKALFIARANKDYLLQAQVQRNLAFLSFRSGDFVRAMDLAQSAVSASSKGGDEKVLALSLGFLGQMELKIGRSEKGRSDLDQALSLYRQNDDLPAQIKTLCFLSGVSLAAKQISLAKEQAESALKIAEELKSRATSDAQKLRENALRWPCWLALARAQRASQQLDDARRSYFRAVSGTVLDWWMVYASTERSAIGFAEERQPAYRELVDVLVELGRTDEAYDVYQDARLRTLSGLIRAGHSTDLDSDTQNQISALSASIIAMRTKLLSPTLSRPQRESFQRELVELEDDLAEKRVQVELNHPRRLAFSKPVKVKQLHNQLLGDDELVLEFCLGEDRSFAWLISRNAVTFEILPGRSEIDAKVRAYVNDLSVAPTNLHLQSSVAKQREMAEELFTILLGKLGSQLRANSKLVVIPDGTLNQVPFESLVHNDRYLIEDFQISYLPSASLIELLRRPVRDRESQLDLLAFGDPAFPNSSKVSVNRKVRRGPSQVEGPASDWDISALPRLPRTRDEVEYIANLIPKDRRRLYLGKESTEKTFKHEPLNKYRWIHLATHSLIDERSPGRSAVVLGLDGNNDEDGFLRATEIADLDLNCELVTLSACETGRGQLSSGEGIIGLSRSFFIAGARSVVVSQWTVSDISTAQLMKDFYQQLVSDVTKPAALREAKLRMLHSGSETRHPYYWAPFVILGTP